MGINIALAGNPNCGKTTMFNDLTGANQYVGNWPGVTVEKKEGKYKKDSDVTVTDLPGIYSLSPYSPEEIVSRDYLLSGEPNVVINLVDSTNLERNLYLTTQILNLGLPVVVALNMMDLVEKRGDKIDVDELSRMLGCPVMETSAIKGRGMAELVSKAIDMAKNDQLPASQLRFSDNVEEALAQIIDVLGDRVSPRAARWYAIKAFEDEDLTMDSLDLSDAERAKISSIREKVEDEEDDDAESIITNERYDAISEVYDSCVKVSMKGKLTTTQKIDRVVTNRVRGIPIFIVIMCFVYIISVTTVGSYVTDCVNDGLFGDGWLYTNTDAYDADVEVYDDAQAQIEAYLDAAEEDGLDTTAFTAALEADPTTPEDESTIDSFIIGANEAGIVGQVEEEQANGTFALQDVTNAMFVSALEVDEPDPATYGLYHVGLPVALEGWLDAINCAAWLQSLIIDGIVAGVGAVLGFIPQLLVLFLLLGILESCGYMARVAFVMDRVFRRFGLSGKSFIPMLIASGCGVPAIMSTKTIENEKDRRMTIMTTTMIPCGAKLPIIALVFGALAGGDYAATWWVAPLFYFLGLAAIIISCIMLRKFKPFRGEAAPFIMELPQYHIPSAKNVLLSMWERIKGYVVKAGTIIFVSSMVIWFLMNFGVYEGRFGLLDPAMDGYINYSIMAYIGNFIAWIFAPLGFGNWESTVTSITGLVAKENVVATVGIITSLGDAATEVDPSMWSAFATMVGGSAVAVMAFCAFNLLCAPCFASIGTISKQMASAKWTWATIGYMTVFAWCVGLMIYQLGGWASGQVAFGPWTVVALFVAALLLYLLFRPYPKDKVPDKSPKAEKIAA
ncbi:MAG: ferrous iron transporter B [Eggerthellaceae bacterium]|nr:ferrous iron transporter B [Eggerthellaceae bacterium]